MKIKDIEIFLIKLTIFLRLLSIISAIVLDYCFEDFDMSSNLLLSPEESESNKFIFKGLKAFARWDGLYFSEIFQNSYQFDKNHVFFPFYPMLLKLLNEMSIWRFFSNRIIGMILSALTLNLILNCFNAVLFNR